MGRSSSKPRTPVPKEEFRRKWARTTSISWTDKTLGELKQSITSRRYNRQGKVIKPKILIFGPTGCGKSTFCNGLVSALDGEKNVAGYFAVGSTKGTFTKGFHPKICEDLCIIDMGGIFETRAISDQTIKDIASGKVPFYTKLTETLEAKEKVDIPTPGKNDVACVVIVISLGMELPQEIKRMIYCILDLAGEGVVSYRLVLTHVDLCDEKFEDPKNLPSIFDSRAVQEAVMEIASQTGIPPTSVSVVRNYANEPETDLHSNILLLHALEKIVLSAYEQVQKRDNMEMMKEMYDDSD